MTADVVLEPLDKPLDLQDCTPVACAVAAESRLLGTRNLAGSRVSHSCDHMPHRPSVVLTLLFLKVLSSTSDYLPSFVLQQDLQTQTPGKRGKVSRRTCKMR